MAGPLRIGLIGGGWRAEFFTRVAAALPERFRFVGVHQRDPDKTAAFARQWGTAACDSLEALADLEPEFVVVSVSASAHLHYARELHRLGLPVLCETPAAPDLESLLEIWRLVEQGLRFNVAEQYWLQPMHAARLALVGSGRLGRVSFARISAAHGYHGVSLMRRYLGIGGEVASIRGRQFTAEVVEGASRRGPPEAERLIDSKQLLAEFDFGDRLGLFDFTDVQYWSYVRSHRVMIRGSRGELVDEEARYLADFRSPVVERLHRSDRGRGSDLEGLYLQSIRLGETELFRNPFPRARLMDDEIAIAMLLERMGTHVRDGAEAPYAFAEAAQDQYLALLMQQAAETGEVTNAQPQAWWSALRGTPQSSSR